MFSKKLLSLHSPLVVIQRNVGKKKYNWFNEGIQYPGFKYYPRHKDFEDPPYEPTKLFRVKRIAPLKGLSHLEKELLKSFSLDGEKNNCFNVVKNIPENNGRLWKIKHLIEIVPITFPDGFPAADDRTCLHENGELRIVKKLNTVEKQLELTENFSKLPERMDGDTIRRSLRKKWLNGFETVQ
ncbi:39S ribosomal protein L30, mitochondrial [Sitophilus oryzae]|uniref:39S ribosomal protein L30, mitochondrial n=1 Tax=Sitophilus oryzae TaxID=7048 RepID=A0A6J2Y0M5_SITOR|nr:39S ribosomal protein L30, mitochondrial [Sitophilus oryzae]